MTYHSNLSPVAVNICSDGSNIIKSNNSFTGSPHPSLQAINPLVMSSPTHMDYNPNGIQLTGNQLGENDLPGMTYLNTDTSPPVALTDYNHHPHGGMFAINEMSLAAPMMPHAERRTPISLRLNAGVPQAYPQVIQRVDSPNSGAASSISAARSAGYPNSNSLERNAFFIAPRTPSQHNMASLARQTSFGGAPVTTTPNGTFGRPVMNYTPSHPASQQMGARSNGSSFTPTHTLMNGRMRTNAMAISYYGDRGPSSNSSYGEKTPSVDQNNSVGGGQLSRRGSYNTYKPQNPSHRMNTSQLLDTYLQRYNDQLQSVRAMNRQESPARYACEPEGSFGGGAVSEHYRLQLMRPTGLDVQNHSNAESTIIPPPNAFGAHGSHVPDTQTGDVDRPVYQHNKNHNHQHVGASDDGAHSFDPTQSATPTATVRPSPNHLIRPPQINVNNAPVKHPSPNQALIYQNDGQDSDYPRYGCLV